MWAPCGAVAGGWWIVPLVGMIVFMGVMAVMMWAMMRGRGFMCLGGHGGGGHDLQREVRELKQEVQELRAARPSA